MGSKLTALISALHVGKDQGSLATLLQIFKFLLVRSEKKLSVIIELCNLGSLLRHHRGSNIIGSSLRSNKAESLQLGFFSSLFGFFDFAENWYVGMLHNISHKFHPCFTHVGPKNGPIEKCLTAFHKFHPCFTHVGPKNGHIEKCLAAFHMFHPCFSL